MDQLASLRQHLEQKESTLKRAKPFELSRDEVLRLLNHVVMPALNKVAHELKPYFQIVKTRGFVNKARLLIQERRTSFVFQVDINNSYEIEIIAHTYFGTFPKDSYCRIFKESIRVEDFKLLTEEKIIESFTSVFPNRDEITEKVVREQEEFDEKYPPGYFEQMVTKEWDELHRQSE